MLEKVIDILDEFVAINRNMVTENSKLVADLGLSSLDVINVVVEFEDQFEIEIPEERIREFVTVGDIVDYLEINA